MFYLQKKKNQNEHKESPSPSKINSKIKKLKQLLFLGVQGFL